MFGVTGIRRGTRTLMAAAMVLSYVAQKDLFLRWGVDPLTAHIMPIIIDVLTMICASAVHLHITRAGKIAVVVVLLIGGGGSLYANFVAGSNVQSGAVHAAAVLAYLLAEWVSMVVKDAPPAVDQKRSEAARKAAATRKANATKSNAEKRTRKPRAPKATTVAQLEAAYAAASAPVSPAA
jgi:hypothetical protein